MDDVDRRLLRLLQANGRATNVELSKRANLSQAATHERVRRLQAEGVIEGYSVRLSPAKLDRRLLVFVEVTLERTSTAAFAEFAAAVARTPEVLECHMVAGGFDYLVKVRVRDMDAYRGFLGDTLARLPGIRQTHTYTVMEEVKTTTDLPLCGSGRGAAGTANTATATKPPGARQPRSGSSGHGRGSWRRHQRRRRVGPARLP